MTKKRRRNKVELQKKKNLMNTILDKWVCVKQVFDNETKYIYLFHRLRDKKSHNRIEQTVLSPDPFECGVYYITDYDIDKILDWAENREIIEIRPMRFDLEIGLYSEKEKITSYDELKNYLVDKKIVSNKDILKYTNFNTKVPDVEEIILGYNHYPKIKEATSE